VEPELSRMAQRVLQAGVASSANERVFSGWKHIIGDKRTRLGKKRQRDEMYIFANSRMCKNAKKGDKTWAAECDQYVEYSDCSDDEPELSDDE
jgi:hypothetical protein